ALKRFEFGLGGGVALLDLGAALTRAALTLLPVCTFARNVLALTLARFALAAQRAGGGAGIGGDGALLLGRGAQRIAPRFEISDGRERGKSRLGVLGCRAGFALIGG